MTRIMYIERKAGELTGSARIGRVTFSKNRKTLHYRGMQYRSLHGRGFKANYCDSFLITTKTGEPPPKFGKRFAEDRNFDEA